MISLRLGSQARAAIRSGETGFAIKHLTKTLLRNPKDFHIAAAALLVEAKYLAKLNHPNIIKVTGLAMGSSCQQAPSGEFVDHSRRRRSGPDERRSGEWAT